MKTCDGRSIIFLSLMLIAGLIGAEYADALNSSAGQLLPVEGNTTLTVVFGPPDVFDPGAGAGVPMFDGQGVTSGEGAMVGIDFAKSNGPAMSVSLMASVPNVGDAVFVSSGDIPATDDTVFSAQSGAGAVPEPSTLFLLGLGILGLFGLVARRRKK